ncbi:TOPRIM nucleotidyl transferase/hydrolase domain-containing protein, partial [Arenimonas malthae]|uniref:TOPRIM nucleotidyl transferase/hydrolase domain-containing protein n=1 Tax=Arenimonas malthae TaxID=354197 RepID=UPI00146FE81D
RSRGDSQFDLRSLRSLRMDQGKTVLVKQTSGKTDREIRILLGQFGLRPIEALLAKKVILVEGPSDVALVRSLFRVWFGMEPDRLDVLVIPCGGKVPLVELGRLLRDLGVGFLSVLDYDAGLKDNAPYFDPLPAGASGPLVEAIDQLISVMHLPNGRKPKAVKSLESMKNELDVGPPQSGVYAGSVLDAAVRAAGRLSASQVSQVSSAVVARKPSRWIDLLWDAGVWLWSDDPEALLTASGASRSVVEGVLRARGQVSPNSPVGSLTSIQLFEKLHGLAHEPSILEEVVVAVLAQPAIGTNQFSKLRQKLAAIIER